MVAPLPPVAAGTVKSVIAVPAVKVLAVTEPVPKDGAESVPRMVTVAEEGVPMVKPATLVACRLSSVTDTVSSPSAVPSVAMSYVKKLL